MLLSGKEMLEQSEMFINDVIKKKYLLEDENNYNDLVDRFYRKMVNDNFKYAEEIRRLMLEKKFIPAGSILFSYGTDRVASLSNCYFLSYDNDSLESIFKTFSQASRIFSWRGGVGFNQTTLRPKNEPVNNSAKNSTGSVSFMPLISDITNVIGQKGRRGASLICLDCRHPDVIDFIKSKSNPEEVFGKDHLTGKVFDIFGANISVLITDDLMQKYINDDYFEFVFPDIDDDKEFYNKNWNGCYEDWISLGGKLKTYGKIKARELVSFIAEQSWKINDPGVIYWNNVINQTFMSTDPKTFPRGMNPCGEQILPNYGNCLLLCTNLAAYVQNPWTDKAKFMFEDYLNDIAYVLEFGDYIIDINNHPLEEQNELSKYDRKIGHETTGLADMLAMLGYRYGDANSLQFIEKLYQIKLIEEFICQVNMAKEKGSCPAASNVGFDVLRRTDFISKIFDVMKNIMPENQVKYFEDKFLEHGIRNFGWSTQGPCGSISIIAGNTTSGIEPLFAIKYTRHTRLSDKPIQILHQPLLEHLISTKQEYLMHELNEKQLCEKFNYVTSMELDYLKRINVQEIIQKHITDSISSTINLPSTATPQDIEKIYVESWKRGLKGITVFRNGTIQGVLEIDKTNNTDTIQKDNKIETNLNEPENGKTHIVKWKNAKVYITVTTDKDGKPSKIFSSIPWEAGLSGNDENDTYKTELLLERMSHWSAICRLTSVCLSHGVSVEEVIKQLKKSSYNITHIPRHIMRILSEFIAEKTDNNLLCPVCKNNSLIVTEGCVSCTYCGYSKCD